MPSKPKNKIWNPISARRENFIFMPYHPDSSTNTSTATMANPSVINCNNADVVFVAICSESGLGSALKFACTTSTKNMESKRSSSILLSRTLPLFAILLVSIYFFCRKICVTALLHRNNSLLLQR